MSDTFKKIASTWSEVYELTQEYLEHVRNSDDKTVRIFGYGSLIFSNTNEKQGSEIANEPAILKRAKVSLNLMAAGEGEYRGEYNKFSDERARRSTGVYMGMEQGNVSSDFAQGLNVTVDLDKAEKSLKFLYERELGKLPDGITFEELFKKNNKQKFESIPPEQNNLKLYKLAITETEIILKNGENKKVLSLAVPTNEKTALAAVGRSALEIAVMVAQGQGINRKKGDSAVGGDAVDYFLNNLNNFRKNDINVPFMEEVNKALEKYLEYSCNAHQAIKSGKANSKTLDEIYEKSGLVEYSYKVEDKSLPKGSYNNSGITSPFFNASLTDQLTKREDFTKEEYAEGLAKIPHTAALSIERLAALYQKHYGSNEKTI